MVSKTPMSSKSKLRSWLFNKPAKFAGMSLILLAATTGIYAFIKTMIHSNTPMSELPVILIISAVLIFGISKLVKWLPKENLDRRSFVAVDNGLTIICYLFFFLSTMFLVTSAGQIMLYMMWIQYYSMTLFFVTLVLASFVYLYVIGLLISNMYAVYRRALYMGIPKWKVMLSFPFTFILLWMPAYLLPEKPGNKPVIEIKSKWYSSLTNWVIAQPINAVLVFLFTLVFSALFFNFYSAFLGLFFAAMFGLWVWIKGVDGFRKSISGAFTTFAASLNIALIIVTIGFFSFGHNYMKNSSIQTNPDQVIQLAETPVSGQ